MVKTLGATISIRSSGTQIKKLQKFVYFISYTYYIGEGTKNILFAKILVYIEGNKREPPLPPGGFSSAATIL